MYYLIKARYKAQLRKFIRNCSKLIKHSSLYCYSNYYYIVVELLGTAETNYLELDYKNDALVKSLQLELLILSPAIEAALLKNSLPIKAPFSNHLKDFLKALTPTSLQDSASLLWSTGQIIATEEFFLLSWALSEVTNNYHFIYYETCSNLAKNNYFTARVIEYSRDRYIYRSFEPLVELMGILNYNHDSFSDGGKYNNLNLVEQRGEALLKDGASILDIGIESTRPGAVAVDFKEEINKLKELLPIIFALKNKYHVQISIDSYHQETIEWLLASSWDINFFNDVSGNLHANLVAAIIDSGKKYIAMHNLGIPANKAVIVELDQDPVAVISRWMQAKFNDLEQYGICGDKLCEQLIFDPGIGFGNNSAQAWYLLNNLSNLERCGCELLAGYSRKSLFKHIGHNDVSKRDDVTAAGTLLLASHADYLRLHDLGACQANFAVASQLNAT